MIIFERIYQMKKKCLKCGIEKELPEFFKNNQTPDGLTSACKLCVGAYRAALYAADPEPRKRAARKYYAEHKGQCAMYREKYYSENKDKIRTYEKSWQQRNRVRCAQKHKERRGQRKAQRLCQDCGKPVMPNSEARCEFHFLRQMLNRRIHVSSDALIERIKTKLMEQKWRCPISGRWLVLGINASLDHILPKSKFPEKAQDIENLQWVDTYVNFAKHDMSQEELVTLCREIVAVADSKK
jgi:hypothetical protein